MASHQEEALSASAFDSPAAIEPGARSHIGSGVGAERPTLTCPSCGFTQEPAEECMKCGLVIAKYRPKPRPEVVAGSPPEVRTAEEITADLDAHGYERRVPMAATTEDDGFFAPERRGLDKGMLGGVVMMAIAVIWFGLGWVGGYIYFYPPVLFAIGLYGLVRGLLTGNVAG